MKHIHPDDTQSIKIIISDESKELEMNFGWNEVQWKLRTVTWDKKSIQFPAVYGYVNGSYACRNLIISNNHQGSERVRINNFQVSLRFVI